jgi:hypothetical protein
MRIGNRLRGIGPMTLAWRVVPPLAVSGLFFLLSPNEIYFTQWLLALALLQIPWLSYCGWSSRREDVLPVFAIISFMYWIYYAVSLFWGTRTVSGGEGPNEGTVSNESITSALALCVLAVACLWLGMRIKFSQYLVPKKLPKFAGGSPHLHYVRMLLILGTLLGLYEGLPLMLTESSRQAITILISLLPVLAFAILFCNWIRGEAPLLDKVLLVGFLALRFVGGLSSGWLGSFASVIVICGAVYISERRKMPRLALVLVVVFTLFFQVGKTEFRKAYWQADAAQASKIDRVKFWTETSLTKWRDAFSDPTGNGLREALNASLSRVSLLTQTANVIDMTPAIVPYQNGRLYSYLLVGWIPRALWPEKPSISEANQFYQVAYGLTTEDELSTVSIGVGVAAEGYISFGWFGVVGVMFLIGVFFDCYGRIFLTSTSGQLMNAIGIVLLPQMITIESQLATYLGGITQQVLFTLLVFLPVIKLTRSRPSRIPKESLLNTAR